MRSILIIGALALSFATPVFAKDKPPVFVETAPVKDKPTITLDPAKSYILVRSDAATSLYLMGVASADDQLVYDKLREDALVDAHRKYEKRAAAYLRTKEYATKAPAGTVKVPEKPVEPTEANFEFTPFSLMTAFTMGPTTRFAKGEGGASTYLQEVTPGNYRIYGAISPASGAASSCFCMGSVRFEAKAGEIVDLGMIRLKEQAQSAKARDSSVPMAATDDTFLQPTPASVMPDPRIKGFPVTPAVFHPVGKLPNYFGLTLGRMPAIPGVMRYDRDRIVDLTDGG